MRLLYVADSLDVGGAERALVSDAIALSARGHHVTIACGAGGAVGEVAQASGVPVFVAGCGSIKRRVSPEFACALENTQALPYHIVHSHMFASSAAVSRARSLQGERVVTEHSEANWRGPAARRESQRFLHQAAAVIAVSRAIAARLTGTDHVPAAKIRTLPNALPFLTAATTTTVVLPRGGPLVGFVGRLQPEKGAATFVEAASLLARAFPDARFVIAGDGPQAAALRRQTTHRRLDDQLVFTGFVPDGTTLIRHLDVLIVPSLSEGTPLVVLEAMASGVAVVASRVGGIPDQVRHDQEALLVEPGDHHAIAEACARLLTDEVLRRDLTQRARARLSRAFSPTRRLDQLEALYGEVVARSHTGNLQSL